MFGDELFYLVSISIVNECERECNILIWCGVDAHCNEHVLVKIVSKVGGKTILYFDWLQIYANS